ncbi:hypothetical protein HHU08_20935 [Bacillus sp. UniB3]|uniref:Uncharacterized protein n=1 Tax=Niallia alba TaxID=2729105 RepID=A0A7Y0KCZ5_9BACI|nr:hypothetical protein [Niallia alba]
MSIANRLSRQCGVLSHYLRTSEPVSAEKEPLLLKYKVIKKPLEQVSFQWPLVLSESFIS